LGVSTKIQLNIQPTPQSITNMVPYNGRSHYHEARKPSKVLNSLSPNTAEQKLKMHWLLQWWTCGDTDSLEVLAIMVPSASAWMPDASYLPWRTKSSTESKF